MAGPAEGSSSEPAPLPATKFLAVVGDSAGKIRIIDTSTGVFTPVTCKSLRYGPGAACQCLVRGTIVDASEYEVPLVRISFFLDPC